MSNSTVRHCMNELRFSGYVCNHSWTLPQMMWGGGSRINKLTKAKRLSWSTLGPFWSGGAADLCVWCRRRRQAQICMCDLPTEIRRHQESAAGADVFLFVHHIQICPRRQRLHQTHKSAVSPRLREEVPPVGPISPQWAKMAPRCE